VDREQGGGGGELDDEIAVADGVHGILSDAWAAAGIDEAQLAGDEIAIEGEGAAGEGAGAERADVGSITGIGEAASVAVHHLDVGEAMVGEGDGLAALEVGVAGEEDVSGAAAEADEGTLKLGEFPVECGDFVADPESDVEGDLVIAGAAGVEFGASGDAPGELGLDVHMNVFEGGVPREGASFDFGGDGFETLADGMTFRGGEHANAGEHGGVGDGAADVLPPEAPVKADRLGKGGDVGGGTRLEASGAGDDAGGGRL